MSVGPLGGIIGSAAGSPLSQTQGAAAERAKQDAAVQERGVEADLKTELASGIGQTEEDQGTSERDADGRRQWEKSPKEKEQEKQEEEAQQSQAPTKKPSTGETGERLDLIG